MDTKKRAVNYMARLIIQRLLGLLMFLIGSSFVINLRSGIYFVAYVLMAIICGIYMFNINKETLAQRGKINTNSPKWDKVLLGLYWIFAFFIIYLIAGLEIKNEPNINYLYVIGMLLQLFATYISLNALKENTFLESTARIQEDRNQSVCKTGVYGIVRHPTYSAILIWAISICMVFETFFVGITALFIAVIIIIRTYKEDSMLKNELKGYEEYTDEVKYRLIPYIW